MSDISKKILDTIQEQHMSIRPRWHFWFQNIAMWGAFLLSIITGSISFSVLLYYVTGLDWDMMEELPEGFWGIILANLPFVWISVFSLFVAIAWYYCKHTKHGYRYTLWVIIILSLGMSIVGGMGLHHYKIGEVIDDIAQQHIPLYKHVMPLPQQRWMRPEMGKLAGRIVRMYPNTIDILDFQNNMWIVDIQKVHLPPSFHIREDILVRIMGKTKRPGFFEAEIIRPWIGPNMRKMKIK